MARPRKTHVQQQLRWANAAGDLRGRKRESGTSSRRGNKRLGRPRKPGAKQRHAKRPSFAKRQALHITLRVERDVGSLRKRACYAAVRRAAITALEHEDCRVIHLSIQRTHLHLIVEAECSTALSTGMQAFQISAAKHLNAAVSRAGSWWERRRMAAPPTRRKGRVFADRYHARSITSPTQARRELAYVLNNWRKHREDRASFARTWVIDPFATGWCFDGWRELGDAPFPWKVRDTYDPIPVWLPRTWLLREGWRRFGLISTHEVPSAPAPR
ncbi:MAG: transposase [Deltaproteobacteria bacterium]|nr:transposase [Deltaproteobacteria bacterium]